MYAKYIKRPMDFCLSLLALIILSPLFLIIAILVCIKLGSPVIFKQKRPGKDEKIFTLYKFRTMTDARDEKGNLISDDIRLTDFGKFLRNYSLDELPELWNIVKGDMSIIGPRPLMVYYLPYYTEEEKHRHNTRPGLTGLAQISGRNNLRWEEKFAYDLEYVKTCCFRLDIIIIIKTILNVINHKDVVSGDTVLIGDYVSRPLNIERGTTRHV